jgi:hypothetical protein
MKYQPSKNDFPLKLHLIGDSQMPRLITKLSKSSTILECSTTSRHAEIAVKRKIWPEREV